MPSLRRTLILGTTLATAAVLLAAGVVLFLLVRRGLTEQFDHALIEKARLLASCVEPGRKGIELDFSDLDMSEFNRPGGAGCLQIWLSDGPVLYRSASLGGRDMERAAASPTASPAVRPVALPGGRTGRAVGMTFLPGQKPGGEVRRPAASRPSVSAVTLVLARDDASVQATLNSLKALLLGVGVAAIVASSAALWLAVRRGLRPVNQAADQIARLGDHDLTRRIAPGGAPAELRPVLDRLNDLLARLEDAFRRERAFTADVAHELRTPLAGLRSTMEVALSRKRGPAEYEESLAECLRVALGMQTMVERLLSLARLEAGQVEVQLDSVVPDEVVRSAWRPLEEQARRRNLRLRHVQGACLAVRTDPALLNLIVANILENAVVHADEGGSVEIHTAADDGAVTIRVANTGSRVPPDRAELVFQRFWRGDAARSMTGDHSGLGLPLVKRAAAVLGGAAAVNSTAAGRFEITVSIPVPRA